MTKALLLVARNLRARQAAVTDPGVGVRPRIATRHPAKVLAVVDDEVGDRELVRVENEWRHAEGDDVEPEVDQMRHPEGEGDIEQEDEGAHAEVDGWPGEPRVEDGEGQTRRSETTTSCNVTRTTVGQVAENGLRVDLGGEDLEHERRRQELFAQTRNRTTRATFRQLCNKV